MEQLAESQEHKISVNFQELSITDPEEARDLIEKICEGGESPVVTVPLKYKELLKAGLKPHSDWSLAEVIAATLAREPYLPKGEDRLVCRIKVADPKQIEPRFTGEEHIFQGVVVLEGPIPPENIEIP